MDALKKSSSADGSSADGTAATPAAASSALPPTRLNAALAFAHKHTAWLYSGYTRADFSVGVQLMLGWAVLLGILAPSAVWDWLQQRGASATLVLVLYGLCIQPVMGMALLALPVAILGAGFSSALGFIPTYLAYAANGGSYEGASAAKGATLVASGSVIAALLVVPRMRLGQAALLFYIATFMLSVRLFSTYWVYTPLGAFAVPKLPNALAYYVFLDIAIPAAVALPVVWLVMPSPASRKARLVFCRMLRDLGRLSSGVIELTVADPPAASPAAHAQQQQQQPGHGAAANGGAGGMGKGSLEAGSGGGTEAPERVDKAVAAGGGQAAAQQLRQIDAAVRQGLKALGMLLLVSRAEYDLYQKPRRIKAKAYKQAAAAAEDADTCLSMVLEALTGDRNAPFDLSLCRQLAPQLRRLQAALAGCCDALAATVEGVLPFEAALACLAELEGSRAALAAASATAGGSSEAAVVFSVLRGLFLASATKVRSMFPLVAEAVEALQPGAQAAAAKHFATTEWFGAAATSDGSTEATPADGAPEAAHALLQAEEELVSAAGSMHAAAAAAAAAEAGSAGAGGDAASMAGACATEADIEPPAEGASAVQPWKAAQQAATAGVTPAVVRPSAALEAAPPSRLRRLLDRAGLGRPQLLPALHMLVAFAAAGTLTVCKAAFVGLLGKSDWVAFSVNSVFEKSSGRIRYRGFNRFLGTLMGAAWSCIVIGLTWLINGGYHDSATKYAVMTVLVSLWGFFVGINKNRHPRHSYAWTVCMVAVPVIVLEDFKLPFSPWKFTAYRIACVSIGISLDVVVCSLCFPVTTTALLQQRLLRALWGLADLAEGLAAQQAQQAAGAGSAPPPSVGAAAGSAGKGAGSECGASLADAEAAQAAVAARAAAAAGLPGRGLPPASTDQRQKLRQQARKVKAEVLAGVALSAEAMEGPLPALLRARRRHEAVTAVQQHLMHLIDCLLMAVLVDEAREEAEAAEGRAGAAGGRGGLQPAEQELVLAVGQQIGESLRCLRHVLAGRLPMSEALTTLPALDRLLHQLASATGRDLHRQRQHQHQLAPGNGSAGSCVRLAARNGGGAGAAMLPPKLADGAAGLVPFTAASMGAARSLRGLYHTLALALLPEDAPAVEAAAAEVAAGAAGVAAVAAAQAAALAAGLGPSA